MANVSKSNLKKDLKETCIILKNYFKQKTFPYHFSLSEPWNSELVIEHTNCYRYAFDFPWNYDDQRIMCFLGWSIGKFEYSNEILGFSRFEIDLKRMGFRFQVTKDDITVPSKGYKIVLFIFEDDFHFARQNKNGIWSEKNGFCEPVRLLQDVYGNYCTPNNYISNKPFEMKIYHIFIHY